MSEIYCVLNPQRIQMGHSNLLRVGCHRQFEMGLPSGDINLSTDKTYKFMNEKDIYCNTVNITNQELNETTLTNCGINVMMDDTKFIREPDVVLFFKGELYNHPLLCESAHLPVDTSAESIIIHLYKSYGIEYTLQVLEGIFIFILFDYDYRREVSKLYMVRDPFGIIPFYGQSHKNTMVFSSSGGIFPEYSDCNIESGSYAVYELPLKVCTEWIFAKQKSYYTIPNSVLIDMNIAEGEKKEMIEMWRTKILHCLTSIIKKYTNLDICDILRKLQAKSLLQKPDNNIILYDRYTNAVNISANTWIHNTDITNYKASEYWETMFDYDTFIRNQLFSAKFEPDIIYPFFNTDFVALYFSIPLNLRYMYHTELFGG